MKKQLLLCSLLLSAVFVLAQNNYSPEISVYFETDKHQVLQADTDEINVWLEKLYQLDAYKIEIVAHTDVRGSDSYNKQLAQRRAEAVSALLQPRLRNKIQISYEAVGERRAQFGEDSEQKWKDRRVDIIAYERKYESMDELFGLLQGDPVQRFSIDAAQATVINGKAGTQLWIKGHSFVDANGQPIAAGEIEIQLTEAYDYSDMLFSGLSTHSPEGALQTGGMFRLEASHDGQPVRLADGSSIRAGMPSQNELQDGMSLYVPQTAGKPDNWVNTGQLADASRRSALEFPPAPKRPISKTVPRPPLDTTSKPAPPTKPYRISPPRRPQRNEYRFNPPALTALTMGKQKIKAKEQKAYEKAVDKYQRDSARYTDVHYPNYLKKVEAHKTALRNYKLTIKHWREQLEEDRNKEWELLKAEYRDTDYLVKLEAYNRKIKEWRATKQAMVRDFELEYLEKGGDVTSNDMARYFFSINQLGWINCDRFMNIPKEDKMILSWIGFDKDTRIYVLSESAQSFLRTYYRDGIKKTAALPKTELVKVLAVKIKDGRPQLAILEGSVSKLQDKPLEFTDAGLADIKAHFTRLGGV